MKKSLILILLLAVISLAQNSSIYKVDLFQYCNIVSTKANVNILINSDVKASKISFYLPHFLRKKDYIDSLSNVLSNYHLVLVKKPYYYYVTYKKDYFKKYLYSYKFKYFKLKDFKVIKNLFKNVVFKYFNDRNVLFFRCTKINYFQIVKICKSLDHPFLSRRVQMSIYLFNFDKAKSLGINLSKFNLSLNNLISFTQKSVFLTSNNLLSYQGAINFLISKGVVSVVQSPVFLLTDNQKFVFQSVTNIPYLVSKTVVKDNTVSTQNNISYKDVGLIITILPRVFKKYMFLKLNLVSSSVLKSSDTPIISKILLQNTFKLKKGNALLLTGLNVLQKTFDYKKVPVFGNIPVVKYLFNSKTISNQNRVLTILIKVL